MEKNKFQKAVRLSLAGIATLGALNFTDVVAEEKPEKVPVIAKVNTKQGTKENTTQEAKQDTKKETKENTTQTTKQDTRKDDLTPFVKYYENGKIAVKGTYNSDGIPVGQYETYYQNGQLQSLLHYDKDGLKDGEVKRYHKNGYLWYKCMCVKGKVVGHYQSFYDNGSVWMRFQTDKDGNKIGLYRIYHENGQVGTEKEYSLDGKETLLGEANYDSSGDCWRAIGNRAKKEVKDSVKLQKMLDQRKSQKK